MRGLKEARARSGTSSLVVSAGVTIVGTVTLQGEVLIEGTVDGEVRCSALHIAEQAVVEGLIVAEKVVVLGEFSGAIYADELILGGGSAVEGEIHHRKLVLEKGCIFEGQSRRHDDPRSMAPLPQGPASTRPPPLRNRVA